MARGFTYGEDYIDTFSPVAVAHPTQAVYSLVDTFALIPCKNERIVRMRELLSGLFMENEKHEEHRERK